MVRSVGRLKVNTRVK